ncbi:MAG: phage tail protein [Pseudomonadota bacterium]
MSKVVKAIVGVAAIAVGAFVPGMGFLIGAGISLVGSALLQPKIGGAKNRAASAAQVQIGEVPRQAIVGRAATAGSLVDAFNYGGKYGTDWEVLVLAIADHRCAALEGFYVNDAYVAFGGDGNVAGYNGQLQVFWRPGTEDQTVPSILTANGPGWTANDNGAGVAHVVVAYKADDPEAKNPVWPGGRPRFLWVVRGAYCYDPRKDSSIGGSGAHRVDQPATWEYSDNPIVTRYKWVRGFYACDRVGDPTQLLIGRGLSAIEAPPANVFARANLCDELVDGEKRYRVGGAISATESFIEVEEDFAAACAGVIVQPEGCVEIDPGEARAVVATFTDKDLLVGSRVRWNNQMLSISSDEWVNTVVPSYIEPAQKWQEHSAPVRRDPADLVIDGSPREQRLLLGFVTWTKQAQRVGEIVRRLGRLPGRAEVTLPPRFAYIEEGDWVQWQSDRRFKGATYTFRVEAWSSNEKWHHTLTLRQISASVYSDTAPLDDGSVAAQQPAPPAIGAPAADAWALAAGHQDGGSVRTPALIVTGAKDDPAVRFVRIEYVQSAVAPEAGTVWNDTGVTGPDVTRKEIPVAPGGTYYVAVSYVVDSIQGDRRVLGPVTAGPLTLPDGTPIEDRQPTDRSPTPPLDLPEGTLWIAPDGHPYRFGRRPWVGADGNAWIGADGEPWLGSGYEDVQDQVGVQAMAAAEAVTAEVARIASDGWLTAGEKSGLVLSHKAMIENHIALDAKAAALGVAPTERANATASVNALNAYLSSLTPPWNDTTQDTQASAASITGLWGDAAQKVAVLQAAIQGLPGPAGTPGTNGVDGIDGTDGKLVEFVWKRAAAAPAAPAGNGIPAGWSDDPPAGADPLWMSKAKQELDGTLVAGESWSTPIRHDGPPGISPVSAVAVPASKQFTADSDGVVKMGQLPFNVAIDAIKAGAPIGGTVSVVSVSGCTATAISGGFTIDTISADAGFVQWKIVATDGQEVIGKMSFSRQRDPASGGSVSVNFSSTSWWGDGSYAASGPTTVLPASSIGKLRISGYASFYSAANGTATLTAKLQYRAVGSGTWIDSGFSATGNAFKSPDLEGEPGENSPGDVFPNGELTGLTADAPYEIQLVGNRSTSGTAIASATGFVSMTQVLT